MSVFGPGAAAESNSLAEAVHSLAIEVVSSRTLRGPYRLVCENDSSLSASQSAALFEEFRKQLAVVPNLLTNNGAAPELQLTLQETPSRIVILLRVPGADGEQVRLLEINRSAVSVDGAAQRTPYAVQQLLWKQREPILSAAEHDFASGADASRAQLLLVLTRNALSVYQEAQDGISLQLTKRLPDTPTASRDWAGSIRFSGPDEITIDMPGKRCTGTISDTIPLKCEFSSSRASETGGSAAFRLESTVSLTAACDQRSWMLSSSNRDRTVADRLMLVDAKDSDATETLLLEMPGPVFSLAATADSQSAISVVFNLSTGEYELYRIMLACRN